MPRIFDNIDLHLLPSLRNTLRNAVGMAAMAHVRVTVHEVDGRDVCRIHVTPSPDPVWVKESGGESLYARIGNTTRALSPRDAADYVRRHWAR